MNTFPGLLKYFSGKDGSALSKNWPVRLWQPHQTESDWFAWCGSWFVSCATPKHPVRRSRANNK